MHGFLGVGIPNANAGVEARRHEVVERFHDDHTHDDVGVALQRHHLLSLADIPACSRDPGITCVSVCSSFEVDRQSDVEEPPQSVSAWYHDAFVRSLTLETRFTSTRFERQHFGHHAAAVSRRRTRQETKQDARINPVTPCIVPAVVPEYSNRWELDQHIDMAACFVGQRLFKVKCLMAGTSSRCHCSSVMSADAVTRV